MNFADHTGRLTSLQATRLTDCLTRTIHQTPSDRIVETGRKNDCFKKFEELREAGAVIAAREWTSHDVESTIADVGPFPSIRTQGTIESTREARSAGRKPPEPPACIP